MTNMVPHFGVQNQTNYILCVYLSMVYLDNFILFLCLGKYCKINGSSFQFLRFFFFLLLNACGIRRMMVVEFHAFTCVQNCKSENICFDNQKFYPLSRRAKVLKFIACRLLEISLDSTLFIFDIFFLSFSIEQTSTLFSVTNKNTFYIQLFKVVSDSTTFPLRFLSRAMMMYVGDRTRQNTTTTTSIKKQSIRYPCILISLNGYGFRNLLSSIE